MFIASQKKKENIAEYILYMWQIEDIIRSFKFDMDLLNENVILQFGLDEDKSCQMREWYESLIAMMMSEGKKDSGHLQMVENTLNEVNTLHKALLMSQKYPDYVVVYYKVLPLIAELRAKEETPEANDVKVLLSFLYGILILKLKGQKLSDETANAQMTISRLLSKLSKFYIDYKSGNIDLDIA